MELEKLNINIEKLEKKLCDKKYIINLFKKNIMNSKIFSEIEYLNNSDEIYLSLDDVELIILFIDNGIYKIIEKTHSWKNDKYTVIKLINFALDSIEVLEWFYILKKLLYPLDISKDVKQDKEFQILVNKLIRKWLDYNHLLKKYLGLTHLNEIKVGYCHLHNILGYFDYFLYNDCSIIFLNDDRLKKYYTLYKKDEKHIEDFFNKQFVLLGNYKVLKRKYQYIDKNYGFDNEKVNDIINIINPNIVQIMLCEEDKRPYIFFINEKFKEAACLAPVCGDAKKVIHIDHLDRKYCKRNGIDILLGVENDS